MTNLKRDKEESNKIRSLTEDLQNKNEKLKELEDKAAYQEDYNRRKNLQITGLAEQAGETWEKTAEDVSSLLESKLQLPKRDIERANRVDQQKE